MKEGMHRVSKLIENWADERSIAGVIDIDGMVRREDYGELDKWMYQPRVIGRYSKRTQMFFKILTQLSIKELAEKQKKYCLKYKLGLSTKVTNPVHTQRIGYIAGANMKISS